MTVWAPSSDSVEAIKARTRQAAAHNLAVHDAANRQRGRPALTKGEKPAQVNIRLTAEMLAAIDATGQKRSTFARNAIAKALEALEKDAL